MLPSSTPLYVAAEHWGALPVSQGRFPLAGCFTYGKVYVSVLLSQFVPPSPSHTKIRNPVQESKLALCSGVESDFDKLGRRYIQEY